MYIFKTIVFGKGVPYSRARSRASRGGGRRPSRRCSRSSAAVWRSLLYIIAPCVRASTRSCSSLSGRTSSATCPLPVRNPTPDRMILATEPLFSPHLNPSPAVAGSLGVMCRPKGQGHLNIDKKGVKTLIYLILLVFNCLAWFNRCKRSVRIMFLVYAALFLVRVHVLRWKAGR